MDRIRLWVLALSAGISLGCETPVGPGDDVDAFARHADRPAAVQHAVVARVSGSGQRDASGAPVLLDFSVVKFADGSVSGSYYFRAIGTDPDQWLRVRVTCMTIVDGNKAWVAGITEDAFLPSLVGRVSYFYAFDNGEGAGAEADVVSLVRAGDVDGEDQTFCNELPTALPQREVVRGNVNITG